MKEKSTTHREQASEGRGQGSGGGGQGSGVRGQMAEGGGPTTEDGRQQVSDHRTAEGKLVLQLTGEERYLESVMGFARGLKCSRDREIAKAARDWESTLDFRIRMEMQERKRRSKLFPAKERRPRRESPGPNAEKLKTEMLKGKDGILGMTRPTRTSVTMKAISSRSGVHIRVGVSPNRD